MDRDLHVEKSTKSISLDDLKLELSTQHSIGSWISRGVITVLPYIGPGVNTANDVSAA